MKVRYDSSQDITLRLTKEEEKDLTEKLTEEFHDTFIRGVSHDLQAYVYLAHSRDNSGILKNSRDLDGRTGRILIPEPGTPDAWLINLSDEGIRHLRSGWNYGVRYNGSSKLFIMVED